METLLEEIYPKPEQGKNNRRRIKEAAAIAAYHQQTDYPVVKVLLSDDAPQYKQLTQDQALCWVHDGRHYKKLNPAVFWHQEQLEKFRGKYWDYYQKLVQYKQIASGYSIANDYIILLPRKGPLRSAKCNTNATVEGLRASSERHLPKEK